VAQPDTRYKKQNAAKKLQMSGSPWTQKNTFG
jgi:hypothetical protein